MRHEMRHERWQASRAPFSFRKQLRDPFPAIDRSTAIRDHISERAGCP